MKVFHSFFGDSLSIVLPPGSTIFMMESDELEMAKELIKFVIQHSEDSDAIERILNHIEESEAMQ